MVFFTTLSQDLVTFFSFLVIYYCTGESGSNTSKNLPVQEDEVSIADVPDQEKTRNSGTDDSYGSETEEDTN